MAHIIEISDLSAPELAPYTQLTHAQLRSQRDPEKGIFIAESGKVKFEKVSIGQAQDALLNQRAALKTLRHALDG